MALVLSIDETSDTNGHDLNKNKEEQDKAFADF